MTYVFLGMLGGYFLGLATYNLIEHRHVYHRKVHDDTNILQNYHDLNKGISAKEWEKIYHAKPQDLTSNKIRNWIGVTYYLPHWILGLWKRFCCKHGWHLFDEYASLTKHRLYCDACGLAIDITTWETET